jgi:hypothetical protein
MKLKGVYYETYLQQLNEDQSTNGWSGLD